MLIPLFIVGGVFIVAMLVTPTLAAGWFWDSMNALGFAAFAGLLILSVARGASSNVAEHRWLGFAVLGITTAHGVGLLLGDTVSIEYLKFSAPLYMWSGLLGFAFLVTLITIGLPANRQRLYRRYSSFKGWHRGIAALTIVGAGHHIIGSRYYLSEAVQASLLALLTVAVLLSYRPGTDRTARQAVSSRGFIVASAIAGSAFVVVRNAVG